MSIVRIVLPLLALILAGAVFGSRAAASGHDRQSTAPTQIVIGPPISPAMLADWQHQSFVFKERQPSAHDITALQAVAIAAQGISDPHAYVATVRFGKLLPGTLPDTLPGKAVWVVVFANNTKPLLGKPGIQPVTSLGVVGAHGKDLGMLSYSP